VGTSLLQQLRTIKVGLFQKEKGKYHGLTSAIHFCLPILEARM
jgi:hypothetical protein